MDFNGLMPLFNMLQGAFGRSNNAPVQNNNAMPVSTEDKEYIKKNTSIFPSPYSPSGKFTPNSEKRVEQSNNYANNTQQTQQNNQKGFLGNMDLNSILPLISNMGGSNFKTDDIAKAMSGMSGNGMSGLVNLFTNLTNKTRNENTQKSMFSEKKIDLNDYKKDE